MASFSGFIPANALTDTNQLFAGLLDFTWRGVSFPTTSFRMMLRQDLAIHKFADRDGAHIEATGRAPLQISARIPFFNGLQKGVNETWKAPLYPKQWRAFLVACLDRTSGQLQHPEMGNFTCKVETCTTDWSAHARGGVEVDVTWIESDDSSTEINGLLSIDSPLMDVASAAADLDQDVTAASTSGLAPGMYVPPVTLQSLTNQVKGAIDQTTVLQKQFAGQIDNLIYQATSIQNSVDMANNSLNWPMTRAVNQLKEAAGNLKATLGASGKPVSLYVTQKDSTLSQLASVIPASIVDLITLNKPLLIAPVVPRATLIRYYALAA